MILSDAPAERAILAGICRYGSEAYYEVATLVNEKSFTIESNQIIYSCLKHILEADSSKEIDLPTILSASKEVGVDIPREDFTKLYPHVTGYPYVIIDGKEIGGLVETAKFFLKEGLVSVNK